MHHARLVETRREGTRIYYRAAGERLCHLVSAPGEPGRVRLAEVEQILGGIGGGTGNAERVMRVQLLERDHNQDQGGNCEDPRGVERLLPPRPHGQRSGPPR